MSTKANATHSHSMYDVAGLSEALDGKAPTTDPRLSDARTPTAHTHTIANVTNLQSTLDGKSNIAKGAWAGRPSAPAVGDQYYDTGADSLFAYATSGWMSVAMNSPYGASLANGYTHGSPTLAIRRANGVVFLSGCVGMPSWPTTTTTVANIPAADAPPEYVVGPGMLYGGGIIPFSVHSSGVVSVIPSWAVSGGTPQKVYFSMSWPARALA